MAAIHLNCQVCGSKLIPNPYMDWAVGDRYQKSYFCSKGTYSNNISGPQHARLEIVFPEEEVYRYELCYEHLGKIYQLTGCLDSVVPGRQYPVLSVYKVLSLPNERYHSFSEIFMLRRAYPLNLDGDLKEQCSKIMEKIKNLVVFA